MTDQKKSYTPSSSGRPMDDNIDDLGRKPDGTSMDQPLQSPPATERSKSELEAADKRDVEPRSDADSNDATLGV